jgi:hypothetical protein
MKISMQDGQLVSMSRSEWMGGKNGQSIPESTFSHPVVIDPLQWHDMI